MLNSREAYKKTEKSQPKDTRYVLTYIDRRIREACNQGKFYIILNNKITRKHFFGENQHYYISETPKVLETLYTKGYNTDYFADGNGIKIRWGNKKEKGAI